MPRRRRGCSRCSRRDHVAVIGVDDDRDATIARRAGARLQVRDGSASTASRPTMCTDQSRLAGAAGPAQRPERRGRDRRRAGARADRRRRSIAGPRAPIPACRTGWSGSPRRTACCSSTTARRPTRPRPRRRSPPSRAIHWILGGLAKTDDLDDCAPYFGHVRAAYTIGEAGPMFARLLDAARCR